MVTPFVGLPINAGTNAIAFDVAGGGQYAGVSHGRILKYINPILGFVDFAVTGESSYVTARITLCWNPFVAVHSVWGLIIDRTNLYIADAYFDPLVVLRGP
ncbi:hypothetical protein WN944_014025 [Citrus x changshan-huyou]|uniref:Uncharacterized protein n=1 Tax=Citrus x changshan-huyou TaxID=2935761 RepID=A0AAP0M649_9ROSI